MSRVVIRVNQLGTAFKIELEEPAPAAGRILGDFQLTASDDALFHDVARGVVRDGDIRRAGSALWGEISKHQQIAKALSGAAGKSEPVYIRIETAMAQPYPWEALYDADNNNGFLALNPQQLLGRIIDTGHANHDARVFEPPLRIMAVLAALKEDGTLEWDGLQQAVTSARSGFDIKVGAVVSTSNEEASINSSEPGAVIGFVDSLPDLFAKIRKFDPHILHFFCHGLINAGATLQLATRSAQHDATQPGKEQQAIEQCLAVTASELANHLVQNSSLWLVVLNSCLSGAATEAGQSIVSALVAKGIPAAIGMRETVVPRDANLFTREFYPSALDLVNNVVQAAGKPTAIDWCAALYRPRVNLCAANGVSTQIAAARTKAWTLPNVYRRTQDFVVSLRQPSADPASERKRAEQVRFLKNLRRKLKVNKAPQDMLDEIDQQIAMLRAGTAPQRPDGNA